MNSLLPSSLRRYRNLQKQSLATVSGVAGISIQHLSEIESNKCDPRLSTIEKVASGLSLSVMLVPLHMESKIRRYIEAGGRSYSPPTYEKVK